MVYPGQVLDIPQHIVAQAGIKSRKKTPNICGFIVTCDQPTIASDTVCGLVRSDGAGGSRS